MTRAQDNATARDPALRFQAVPLMRLPTFDTIGDVAHSNLERFERRVLEVDDALAAKVEAWSLRRARADAELKYLATLAHPLSDYLPAATRDRTLRPGRTEMELAALRKLPAMAEVFAGTGQMEHLIIQLGDALGLGRFRTRPAVTEPDATGCCLVYPEPEQIPHRIEALAQFVQQTRMMNPAFAASVLMVGIENLHPFADGNGRASRVLFNWVMQGTTITHLYLPLYELAGYSRGGYLLASREAQYFNRWEPVTAFLDAGLEIVLALSRKVR